MKNVFLVFLFIGISGAGYSQQVDYSQFKGISVKSQINSRLDAPFFKEYGNPMRKEYVKMTPFNGSQFEGPEKLLSNVYASVSEKEFKKLFTKDAKVDLKSFKQPSSLNDTSKNFLLLDHKLTFNVNSQELSIIKYTQYKDSIPVMDYTIQVLGTKGSWKGVKLVDFNEVELSIQSITVDEFWSLHKKGTLDENDKYISPEILSRVKDEDGVLNLSKLASVIRERKRQGKKGLVD